MSAGEAVTHIGINGTSIWAFEPYVLNSVAKGKEVFAQQLQNALGLTKTGLDDLLSAPSGLMPLIDTQAKRKTIKAAYTKTLGLTGHDVDLNLTSLCLYAGPSRSTQKAWRSRWPINAGVEGDWSPRLEVGVWRKPPGWLHTGDASLKDIDRVAELLGHYNARWPSIGTFLLPHHGSDESFHVALLSKKPLPSHFVAAAQPGFREKQRWFHPGRKTTNAVQSAGRHPVTVSESVQSRLTDTIVLEAKRPATQSKSKI